MQTNSHLSVLVRDQAEIYGNRTALEYKEFGGKEWKKVSWNTFSEQVRRVSLALLSLGVGVQEKVAVFSQNTLQYVYTDFGAWGIRACTVPFYATTSEEAIQFMVNDAQIRFIFCGEQEQYDRARRVQHVCPTVEKLIVFDRRVRFRPMTPHLFTSMNSSNLVIMPTFWRSMKSVWQRQTGKILPASFTHPARQATRRVSCSPMGSSAQPLLTTIKVLI